MWVLLERGDAAIVPTPSYPIHMYGPLFAGADLRQVPIRGLSNPEDREDFEEGFFESLHTAYEVGWPKPRVLVISFPHNPTGASVDLAFMQRVVDFCRERGMIVCTTSPMPTSDSTGCDRRASCRPRGLGRWQSSSTR